MRPLFSIAILFSLFLTSFSNAQIFQDQFDDGLMNNVTGASGFTLDENNGEWKISGDGTAAKYACIAYNFYDASGQPDTLDFTNNGKIFIRAKVSKPIRLRLDIQDDAGYVSSFYTFIHNPANRYNSNPIGKDYNVYEYDFMGTVLDGAFGGTPCNDPLYGCALNSSKITRLLIYPDTVAYNGIVTIDWISLGSALPYTISYPTTYEDLFNTNAVDYLDVMGGFDYVQNNGELQIINQGITGSYTPVGYTLHDTAYANPIKANLTSYPKIYIKVKATPAVPLRIDLEDDNNYLSTEASLTQQIDTFYTIHEYDFTGLTNDLAYDSPYCLTGPCPLDMTKIPKINFVFDPGNNVGYNGTLTIDWIRMGELVFDTSGKDSLVLQFDYSMMSAIQQGAGYSYTFSNSEWTITGNGSAPNTTPVVLGLQDAANNPLYVDVLPGDKISIRAKSTTLPATLKIYMEDALGNVDQSRFLEFPLSTQYETYVFDYTGTPFSNARIAAYDSTSIRKLHIFIGDNYGNYSGTVSFDFIKIEGNKKTALATGVSNKINSLVSSSLYPNPASHYACVELNLKSESQVKITLTDLMGKIIYATELYGSEIKTNLEIGSLAKGVYTVQYIINNIPEKAELLLVK